MPCQKIPEGLQFRLPKTVVPLNYDLFIHPDLKDGTYQGRVIILIELTEYRKFIAFHQKELDIVYVELETTKRLKVDLFSTYPVDSLEMYVIEPINELTPGLYNLSISFRGSLKNKIFGFYTSTYKDDQNQTRYIKLSSYFL